MTLALLSIVLSPFLALALVFVLLRRNEERKQRGRIRLVALNQDIVTRYERLEQHPQRVRCR